MNRQQRRAAGIAGKPSRNAPAPTLFEAGIQHLQLGQLTDAERCCQKILAEDPANSDALHLMGLIAARANRLDVAVEYFAQAIRHNPNNPDYFSNLASVLHRLGGLEEAAKSYDRALLLKPDVADGWNNLGQVLQKLNRSNEAVSSYQRALKIEPRHLHAIDNLGKLLLELDRYEEALAFLDLSEQIKPGRANIFHMRGTCLQRLMKFEEALVSYNRAVAIDPDYPDAHNNIATIFQAFGRHDEALVRLARALELRPSFIEGLVNRGITLFELRQFDQAFASFDRAIALEPDHAYAHLNLALFRLLSGDFAAGWAGREWRWKVPGLDLVARPFSQPLWLGDEPLAGKTILLHSDEGLGDTIQFVRYAPMVAELGARVILEIPDALHVLLSDFPGVSHGQPKSRGDLPAFDFHCPLSSLPLAFRTRIETIPSAPAYLHASVGTRRRQWEDRLGPRDRPRVGLVWSGNPNHRNDRNRSLAMGALSPILDLDATFVSLQKGVRPEDKAILGQRPDVLDVEEHLLDFADTAALISCLDLVISVDTSVAHLAGALGCPVWILLPYTPDFRWLLDRDDSPWYPTAQLFRQAETREWASVLNRVRAELQGLIAAWAPVAVKATFEV
jgi:tetratricopeptide (TPR) repeat protein